MLREVTATQTADTVAAAVLPARQPRATPTFVQSFGIAVLMFLLVTAGISLVIRSGSLLSPSAEVLDYRVVACAERVVLQRGDVYRTGALRDCEHALAPEASEPAWSVTPFALPPYSAALLLPFGVLDFGLGRTIWFVTLVLALCATVAAMAQIMRRSAVGMALLLIPTFGLVNLFYGETVLLAIAAAALGALAVQRNRPILAAVAVAAALIEPAIGVPATIGLFALAPAARRTLLVCVAALAVLGVAALGLPANLEYALTFIPAHEHAEIFARDQYSLTRLAYVLGASEHVATLLGSVSYICAIALGVVAARALAQRTHVPALYVLLPVAMSNFGGPFVHEYEVVVALLAAIVLARDSPIARVAVAILTIIWGARWQHNLVPALAASTGIALLYLERMSWIRRAAYAVGVAIAVLGVNAVLPKSPVRVQTVVGVPQPAIAATDLSSLPWEWRIRLSPGLTQIDRANEIEKIPFWFALVCLPLALGTKRNHGSAPVATNVAVAAP